MAYGLHDSSNNNNNNNNNNKIIIIIIIIIINVFLKRHKVVISDALVAVELVRKGRVKQKSFEPRLKNCERGAFENCLRMNSDGECSIITTVNAEDNKQQH